MDNRSEVREFLTSRRAGSPGLSLVTYSAEPGTPSQDGLRLLASWAATQEQLEHETTT